MVQAVRIAREREANFHQGRKPRSGKTCGADIRIFGVQLISSCLIFFFGRFISFEAVAAGVIRRKTINTLLFYGTDVYPALSISLLWPRSHASFFSALLKGIDSLLQNKALDTRCSAYGAGRMCSSHSFPRPHLQP